MTKPNGDLPAFPTESAPICPGLTKREWMATVILAGLPDDCDRNRQVRRAIETADMLLDYLHKTQLKEAL